MRFQVGPFSLTQPPSPEDPEPAFEILEPARPAAPLVFNSPHSGACYPPSFLASTRLDPLTLRRSEDAFVDELFMSAVRLGTPLMRAHFPRAFLDVNREPYELDPRMFDGRLPPHANTRSLRVAGGLGTIARVVGEAQEIYARRLPVAEAIRRIETFYKPYHQALADLLGRMRLRFGSVILIDCHSMPSTGMPRDERPRAEIVLGDRYGTSCNPALTDFAEAALRGAGLVVTRNRPYAGGYITEHYGMPHARIHALQIEINRALYMDEARFEKSTAFDAVAGRIATFIEHLAAFSVAELEPPRAAAE